MIPEFTQRPEAMIDQKIDMVGIPTSQDRKLASDDARQVSDWRAFSKDYQEKRRLEKEACQKKGGVVIPIPVRDPGMVGMLGVTGELVLPVSRMLHFPQGPDLAQIRAEQLPELQAVARKQVEALVVAERIQTLETSARRWETTVGSGSVSVRPLREIAPIIMDTYVGDHPAAGNSSGPVPGSGPGSTSSMSTGSGGRSGIAAGTTPGAEPPSSLAEALRLELRRSHLGHLVADPVQPPTGLFTMLDPPPPPAGLFVLPDPKLF